MEINASLYDVKKY